MRGAARSRRTAPIRYADLPAERTGVRPDRRSGRIEDSCRMLQASGQPLCPSQTKLSHEDATPLSFNLLWIIYAGENRADYKLILFHGEFSIYRIHLRLLV